MGQNGEKAQGLFSEKIDEDEFDVIKLLHDEWKFRLSQLWSLLTKAITLNFILIFMPFVSERMGVASSVIKLPPFIFPLTGFIIAALISFFARLEIARINTINECIKDKIKDVLKTKKKGWVHRNSPALIGIIQMGLAFARECIKNCVNLHCQIK